MFWQKKSDEKSLPDLPPMEPRTFDKPSNSVDDTEIEEEDDSPIEKHSLPSFPDSPQEKGFSQSAIKQAIDPENISEDDSDELPAPSNKKFQTIEFEDHDKPKALVPSMKEAPILPKITKELDDDKMVMSSFSPAMPQKLPEPEKFVPRAPKVQKAADVFVKLDKFYTAKKTMEAVKSKLAEIDSLLNKIRDTRLREDQELANWEKEMSNIKGRVKEVSEGIFERTE